MERFVQECQTIEKRTSSLDDLISLITSKLRENEQHINEAKQKYNWSKHIVGYKREMHTLLKQGKVELQEARSKDTTVSDKVDVNVQDGDSDTDLDDHDEPLPISKVNQRHAKGKTGKGTLKKHRKRKS